MVKSTRNRSHINKRKALGTLYRAAPEAYFSALGRFVTMFSLVESATALVLWGAAGLKPPMAQAVFSGTRMDVATGTIKRIFDINEESGYRKGKIVEAINQLSIITKARNDVLHYGIDFLSDPLDLRITNALFAHIGSKIRTTKISSDILENMTVDLARILVIFVEYYLISSMPDLESLNDEHQPLLEPWLYKSSERENTGKPIRTTPRKPSPRPSPSRG